MACAFEPIATRSMIPTSYELLTPEVKAAHTKSSNRARAKRLRDISNYDDEGPPDKRCNFGMFQLVQYRYMYTLCTCTVNMPLWFYLDTQVIFYVHL